MKQAKLVRDKIPEIISKNNQIPATHTASDEEYSAKLKEKLQEEVDEFLESGSSEELADILEVVYAISEHNKLDRIKLESLRKEKAEKRGSFKNRIILEETKSE